jgi:hypothetical protein
VWWWWWYIRNAAATLYLIAYYEYDAGCSSRDQTNLS